MSTTVLRSTAIGRPITKRGVAIFPVYRPGSSPAGLGLARPGEGFQVREKASPTVPSSRWRTRTPSRWCWSPAKPWKVGGNTAC